MTAAVETTRGWVKAGTTAFGTALTTLTDASAAEASGLPGWTRKHVIAHVAANADALRNLARWAGTGEETPMYSSTEQRNADIEAGAQKSLAELTEWFTASAQALENDFDSLPAEAWENEVRTAQGRTVPFTEVPWMRTREVVMHAVDLGTGVTLAEFPPDCLAALCDDIAAKRSSASGNPALELVATDATGAGARTRTVTGEGESARISAPLTDLTAYLAGRPHNELTTDVGDPAPQLPAWL